MDGVPPVHSSDRGSLRHVLHGTECTHQETVMCTHVVPSTHHDASRACWSVGVGMAPRRGGGLDGGPTSLGLPSCCGGCNTRSQAQAGSSSPHAVTLHRIVKFPFRRSLTIRQSPRARGWVPGVSGPKCSAEKHVRTPTPATPSRRRCGGFLRCAGVGCPVHCTNTKRWSRCRGQRRCQRERRFDNNGGECTAVSRHHRSPRGARACHAGHLQ